jgi:CRP-like cAMP-binding protein
MDKKIYDILARSPVFNGMKPRGVEALLKRVPHRFVKHKKGNMIAFRGDQCQTLMVLIKGSVRGEMVDMDGKAVQVESIPAPRPIAPAFIFGKKNLFPVDVVAETDIIFLSIPKTSLIRLIQISMVLLNNYLDIVSNRAQFLSERLWFMSFKTIKEKFAYYVFNLLKPGENTVTLPKSQQELSEYFGVSRPSLARVIREMETDGIIRQQRREIIIGNLEQFKAFVAGGE